MTREALQAQIAELNALIGTLSGEVAWAKEDVTDRRFGFDLAVSIEDRTKAAEKLAKQIAKQAAAISKNAAALAHNICIAEAA